jgi:hypothetical protein
MGQPKDGTEEMKRYDEARVWLATLIDNPDKTVSVDEYRAQIRAAQKAVAAAHKAWMSWRTERIVDACVLMQDELPRAKRALSAARRSRRDVNFNAYVAVKRLKLEVAKPAVALLDWLSGARRG